MCDKSDKTNLFKALDSVLHSSPWLWGYLRRKRVNAAVHHLEVGAMYGGVLFIKESDFVSFISLLRREGKQLQSTDKVNNRISSKIKQVK